MNSKRILVCSDVHGNCTMFKELLNKASYSKSNDTLIILGDLIDRGLESIDMIKYAYSLVNDQHADVLVIKGNHEDIFQKHWNDSSMKKWFFNNGGTEMFFDFPKLPLEEQQQLLNFIKEMPLWFETEDYIFVHGGIEIGKHPSQCDPDVLLWARDSFIARPTNLEKIVIFGHTPTTSGKIEHLGDKICIDCGAGHYGKLALLELPSMKEYYV